MNHTGSAGRLWMITGVGLVAALVGGAVYAGSDFVWEYRLSEKARSDEQRDLIAQQQMALADAEKRIAELGEAGSVRGAAIAPPSIPVVKTEEKKEAKEVVYKYVAGDTGITVAGREGPVATLKKGTRVIFIRDNGGYSVIVHDGKEYLIPTAYLNDSASVSVDIADIVKEWKPFVVYIECSFRFPDGREYARKSGSGMDYDGVIITNKHVLTDDDGYGPWSCTLRFQNGTIITEQTDAVTISDQHDWGKITITNKSAYARPHSPVGMYGCYGGPLPVEGDEVLILGFPSIGSQTNVTATRGIVSGIEGNFYITDAKIDHGNSGGVAILLRRNCYMGIPTYVIKGELESLGRILDFRIISIVGRG